MIRPPRRSADAGSAHSMSRKITWLAAAIIILTALNPLIAAPATAVTAAAGSNCAVIKATSTSRTTACAKSSYLSSQTFVSIWRDSVSNNTPNTISASCKATTKGTVSFDFSFSASGTIKAWVFADVSAKTSGGIKTSISTGIDVSSTFNIPPFRVTNCDRGILRQNFATAVTETTTHQGRPPTIQTRQHTGYGPIRANWNIKQL